MRKIFRIDVEIFVSRKKRYVHFAFEKILINFFFFFFDELTSFIENKWEKRKIFFNNYEMVNPRLISSLKWKNDCVFSGKKKKEKIMATEHHFADNLCEKIIDFISEK